MTLVTQSCDKNVIFLIFGIPGAGKGTVSAMLKKNHENIVHLAPGDLYRNHINRKTEFSKKIKKYIDAGELVPNDITNEMMMDKIFSSKTNKLIVLDGYPRTLEQMRILDESLAKRDNCIKFVVNIEVDKELSMKRVINRRVCINCNATYQASVEGKKLICDKCGEKLVLVKRKDDTKEFYEKRYKWTMEKVQPVIDAYREILGNEGFHTIKTDEETTIDGMYVQLKKIIKNYWTL